MKEFAILARGLYRPDQLAITYDPSLRMPTTPAIQQWMDRLWQQKLANAQEERYPLYDSQLFRLVHVETRQKGQEDDRLYLILGDTSYKEYTTTRVPEFAQERIRQE